MKRVSSIAAVVGVVVAALLAVAIVRAPAKWHGGDSDKTGSAITAADLATISTNCGITFPSGVQGVRYFWLGSGVDPGLYAKLSISTEAEPQLRASIAALPDQQIMLTDRTEPVWWKPAVDTVLIERVYSRQANYVRLVLCKEADGLVLYVKWFSV